MINKKINNIVNSIKDIIKSPGLTGYFKGSKKTINIMEVCGTHTMAIAKNGITQLLPESINLISGPGCPVCVTPREEIDRVIEIIKKYDITLFTFGDMIRVPGTNSSLGYEKSSGKKIRICYSPADAFDFAIKNPHDKILFLAIGFETTAPITAALAKRALYASANNFYIYSMHKIIPPAIGVLLEDPKTRIDGFLMPGHVCTVTGFKPFNFIAEKYRTPAVISGFEPANILQSIYEILKQIECGKPEVYNVYRKVVKPGGNPVAFNLIYEVFETIDSNWRGIGNIKNSGLRFKDNYRAFDAIEAFPVDQINSKDIPGCECGNILKGIKKPCDCRKFARICTPDNPIGPCMVSSEGACAAYFKYYTH